MLIGGAAFGADPETKLAMNFKNAEIEVVVKFISELTGKNFILDDRVRGTVTVISPTEVTAAEAYEVFQAILGVKGFTIVPTGKILKIMPQADARQSNIETVEGTSEPGDRVITRLVPLKHISASVASQVIEQLRSKFGSSVVYEPTNLIILTDANSNVERLLGILEAIDVPTPGLETEIVRLRYADAATVSNTITQVVAASAAKRSQTAAGRQPAPGGAPAAAQPTDPSASVKIIPDARTNSLIIIADKSLLEDIKSLLAALDIELGAAKGKLNVLQLRYANAETMATVLNSITQAASSKTKTGAQPTPGSQIRPATPAQPQPPATPAVTTGKAEDISVQFDEPVSITADKATNSLIIVAAASDFATLKGVVDRLDVLRPQVLLEAYIIEMSYEKSLALGVEWRTTTNPTLDKPNAVGGTNFGSMSSLSGLASNPFAGPSGMFIAAIDGTVKLGDKTYPNVGALLSALQTRGDIEVLSSPNLLTTDNEEAEIVVSDNIPYKTSTVYDSSGNPRDNFEYRDVGLTLRFTPTINDDNYVKLKLFQESSNVVDKTTGNEIAPSTTKRTTKTTVLVKDGSTVVIGGLIQDRKRQNQSAVPCLGDIPFLGVLFRNQSSEGKKTNLIVFLTPRVVRDDAEMLKLTEEKKLDQKDYERTIRELKKKITGLSELLGDEGVPITLEPEPAKAPKAEEGGK